MFKNQLRHYAGLISLLNLLIGFVIFAAIYNNHFDANVLQRDTYCASRTANFSRLVTRIGPYDQKLRADILDHIRMLRDGGNLVSLDGKTWYKPAATDDRILSEIANMDAALGNENYEYFQKAYIELSRISAQIHLKTLKRHAQLQWATAIAILLGFLGIIAYMFFRLSRADDSVLRLVAENSHIMATTSDGLFVIDENYEIGQRKSNAVKNIFGADVNMTGNFFSFLEPLVSDEDLKLAREFVELLFDGGAKQKLMSDLNPFQEFAIQIKTDTDSIVTKYISLGFFRDESDTENNRMLVSVKDISKEVLLREALDSAKELQNERMNLLMDVLQTDPGELNNFFSQCENTLNEIFTILAAEPGDHIDNFDRLNNISKISHRLKEDAAILGLELFETSIDRIEYSIQQTKEMNHINGEYVLKLETQLNNFTDEIELVKSMVPQIKTLAPFNNSPSTESYDSGPTSVAERLKILAQRVADREGKDIEIDCTGFHLLENDPELQDVIFDITLQLVRNSIVHGIEPAEVRVQLGKKTFGSVSVLLSRREDDNLQLIVRDDGKGLQFSKIREKAINEGLISETASLAISPKNLLKFLFIEGFSSTDHRSVDAGRGIGLDVVKAKVNAFSGKISVRTSKKKYCQFKIIIPHSAT